jgi:hypothetical protein
MEQLNISVGFMPGAGEMKEEELLSKRIWLVHRPSWCVMEATNCQGETDVKRDRLF